jgi:hypothetical protein
VPTTTEPVVRYFAGEAPRRGKPEDQAELYVYPSLEVVKVGSIPETELFMVWASTRPEPELSDFGKNGHTAEDGPGSFAKELGLALGAIRTETGLFDAVHMVGHRILRTVESNPDAEGFALIADLPVTDDSPEPDDEEADEEELQETPRDSEEEAQAPTRRITKRNAKGQIEDSEAI